MTSSSQHALLRVILVIICTLTAAAGLFVIFASGFIVSRAPAALHLEPEVAIIVLKLAGVVALAISYLAAVTARDPIRYTAVINVLVFLLVAASAIDLYALVVVHVSPFYPAWFVIGRSVARLVLALILFALRPRGVA